jgi:hypothetical protein
MKKLAIYSVLGILILAVVAWAAPEKIQSDLLILGRKASSAVKVIEIEQNAGANNPKISSDATDLDFKFFSKLFTFGRGLAEDVRLIVNRGGSNPEMKWNESLARWEFSNDGALFKAVGSGGGGGGGVLLNENSGFEDGALNWTASGSSVLTITETAANVAFGLKAASWDASAGGETLSGQAVDVPSGLFGKICTLSFYYKGGDGNIVPQVYDGSSVIAEGDALVASTNYSTKQQLYFTCPSSGTIQPRFLANADAAEHFFDDVKIGQDQFQVDNIVDTPWIRDDTVVVPQNFGAVTVDGFWKKREADKLCIRGTFAVGTAAAATAYMTLDSAYPIDLTKAAPSSSLIWDVGEWGTLNNANHQVYGSANSAGRFAVDGTNDDRVFLAPQGATQTYTTVNASTIAGLAGNKVIIRDLCVPIVGWAEEMPQQSISVDKSGWYIDANIGGANPSLGLGAVASYTEIINAGLDMVLRSGSAAAEIPCSTTNPSSGLTCSAGSESLGVAFTPPTAGQYEVCAEFPYSAVIGVSGAINPTFQLIETPNNAQTLTQEGGGRAAFRFNSGAAGNSGTPVRTCGTFSFSDTSKRTVRLMYEQTASGAASSSLVEIDRAAASGQRDMKITVRRKIEFQDAIKFTNLVTTDNQLGAKVNVAQINMAATTTCDLVSQMGDWIDSVAYAGVAGDCTVTLNPVYASSIYCWATSNATATTRIPHVVLNSVTSLTTKQRNTSNAADTGEFTLACMGI